MAKYADFRYREDTYGERVRREVPVRILDRGYDVTATGDTVANVVVQIGPMAWDPLSSQCPVCLAPVGSNCVNVTTFHPERLRPVRVAVLRSYSFYPPDPDRLTFEQEANLGSPSNQFLMYLTEDEAAGTASGSLFTYRSGQEPLGTVQPGSVLYISVYISEKFESPDGDVWLPWDLRGQSWAVIPNNYGGVRAAMDALPRGVMTGGRLYAEHVLNPQTLFMQAMGYVLDMVVTDGEMMVNPSDRIHPNIVMPLLRGFGMDFEEEALFADRTVRHRLKHVLSHYYEIRTMKGTQAGLERYIEAVTGLPAVVTGPVNLLLDRSDTCPDNWLIPPDWVTTEGQPPVDRQMPYQRAGINPSSQLQAIASWNPTHRNIYSTTTSATSWEAIPSLGYEDAARRYYANQVFPVAWPALVRPPVSPFLANGTTPDLWYDPKNPVVANLPQFNQAITAIHYFEFTNSMTYGSRPTLACSPLVTPGEMYTFRFRFWPKVAPMTVYAELFFFDAKGTQVYTYRLPDRTGIYNDWNDYEPGNQVAAPSNAKYVRWRITATKSGATGVRIGAIQLAPGGAPDRYRDPRSMAVLLDTGAVEQLSTGARMNDTTVTMNDGTATMNDGTIVGGAPSVDRYEQSLIAKLKSVLPRYLPAGVSIEILTPDDIEFTRFSSGDRI